MLLLFPSTGSKLASGGKFAMHATRRDSEHQRALRLARLAMLIECEGSITIGMTPPTKTRCRPALYPTVDITNTSTVIIDEAKTTLMSEYVDCTARPVRYQSGWGRKLRYDINIHGFDRLTRLLPTIIPYLNSKKMQAEIVMRFIRSRMAAVPKSEYSEQEWQWTTQIRKLNGKMPPVKAVAKAVEFLASLNGSERPRTISYYRRYVAMCAELRETIENSVAA
jgi:hypothetical protein